MARLRTAPSPSPSTVRESSLYRDRTPTIALSDQENAAPTGASKGKGRMPPPDTNAHGTKRRRLGEFNVPLASQVTPGWERDHADEHSFVDLRWYNPDQDEEERRQLRRDMRENLREFNDRRDALLNPENNDLVDIIHRQNRYMDKVRQTADATIDSRFLVSASDLTLRKTTQFALGGSSVGLDIDDFVSKCIHFMKNGGPLEGDDEVQQSTQRRQQSHRDLETSDDENDNGDALPWHILGKAAFSTNHRPPIPSFLLGPLSVQKRARAATQRTGRLRRDAQAVATNPQELQADDLQKAESSNLTTLVSTILRRLEKVMQARHSKVDQDLSELQNSESMNESNAEEVQNEILKVNGLADNWEISLFEFIVNPHAFSQTVENLFYLSFLIKEGRVAVNQDSNGLPTIRPSNPRSMEEQREENAAKHQAIFSLDYATWHKLIDAFDIKRPLIPHRRDEDSQAVSEHGWYS